MTATTVALDGYKAVPEESLRCPICKSKQVEIMQAIGEPNRVLLTCRECLSVRLGYRFAAEVSTS